MMQIVIRDVLAADAGAIQAAEMAVAATPGRFNAAPDELAKADYNEKFKVLAGTGKYIIAERDGAPVGHARLTPLPWHARRHVRRLQICVHPGCQRQGVGKILMQSLIGYARSHPEIRRLELEVLAVNTAAFALYQSCGFVLEGTMRDRVELATNNYSDVHLMALETF